MYNFIGAEIGAISTFLIARRFRDLVIRFFSPLEKIREWQSTIDAKNQFWAFLGLRFFALSAFNVISYAAGLSSLSFRIFIIVTLIIDIPVNLAFFYFGGLTSSFSYYLFAIFTVPLLLTSLILWLQSQRKNYLLIIPDLTRNLAAKRRS
ncbi:MAG: VTT domain-containing protein [Candidatus Harrisonbacteria bacterium]|nr:VTT domain-containing protein [Candidatus Harrisonbacteria bacterium]